MEAMLLGEKQNRLSAKITTGVRRIVCTEENFKLSTRYLKRGDDLVAVLDYPIQAYVSGWCSFQREISTTVLRKPTVLLPCQS